jgi:nucleoporin SEH1
LNPLLFFLFQVWHLDWDMSGMTLATSGSDGNVRLWQASFGGQWQQQGIVASMRES